MSVQIQEDPIEILKLMKSRVEWISSLSLVWSRGAEVCRPNVGHKVTGKVFPNSFKYLYVVYYYVSNILVGNRKNEETTGPGRKKAGGFNTSLN